jgi:hypothetical protein
MFPALAEHHPGGQLVSLRWGHLTDGAAPFLFLFQHFAGSFFL